jgi:Sugar phosphate isomerases/epimerases
MHRERNEKMKFGTLYSYWGNEWKCDYIETMKKVSDIGFDILEVGAQHLVEMTDGQLDAMRHTARGLGLTLTANIGPAKDKDLASPVPEVREAGVKYLIEIMKAMDKIDSRSLVGAMYSFWPCDFQSVDKEGAWKRSIASMKEVAGAAEALGIECCQEVLNRYETYIMTDCEEGLRYCELVGSRNVLLLLDTFHMNIEEDNIPEAIRKGGARIGHIHVGEANRKLPGMGSLPWREIGRALRDIGYEKGVVMEPFLLPGGKVAEDIKVWRDLGNHADEGMLDGYIKSSLDFLKHEFTF